MKDILIIGTGPAGFSAAVYAKRYELDIVVVGEIFGGTVTKTHLIENWPGIKTISGFELGMQLHQHAQHLGVEIKAGKIIKIEKQTDGTFISEMQNGEKIHSKTIIYGTGTHHRELGIPTEEAYKNKGVSYCATCDGAFFKDKIVGIVGGSDSAVKDSLLLSQYATKVYIIYRKETPRAEPINMKRMRNNDKIEVIGNSNVVEISGEGKVEKVKLDTGEFVELSGLFIEIGSTPNSQLAKEIGVETNEKGEIITDKFGNTNIKGFFAAGDVTDNPFKQAIVSASEGSHCANQAFELIQE